MFERIKNALAARRDASAAQAELQHWAQQRDLGYQSRRDGGFTLAGSLAGRAFRAECVPSTRSYIQGFELKARVELAVNPEVGLVLMNRALKSTFEALANALFEDVTNALETGARQVPEEVRWLSLYRDVGWVGPTAGFWSRHAVLTDVADVAREVLTEDLVNRLMNWPASHREGTPTLFLLDRGNAYLRLQMSRQPDALVAVHALEALDLLASRFAVLLPQQPPGAGR